MALAPKNATPPDSSGVLSSAYKSISKLVRTSAQTAAALQTCSFNAFVTYISLQWDVIMQKLTSAECQTPRLLIKYDSHLQQQAGLAPLDTSTSSEISGHVPDEHGKNVVASILRNVSEEKITNASDSH